MKKLDVSTLEIFISAVEERSLSKAAERENLVTSAVSKRITELEQYLHKILFLRHGRGVEPTPAGTLLYQHAKSIVRNIKQTENLLNEFDTDGLAKVRLMANPSTILQFLPIDIAKFLSKNSNTSIDLIDSHSYDIPRLIIEEHADIGIYHADQPATGVISWLYKKDRVGLVVPNGHPLSMKKELYLEDALDYDLLGYFPRHSLESFLDYIGATISRPPNVKLQVSNFETRCRMIQEGIGIGVVPEQIAANYLQQMGLQCIHLLDDWAERQFYLCVNNTANRKPIIKNLVNTLLHYS